jgi:death-on-curing family protein
MAGPAAAPGPGQSGVSGVGGRGTRFRPRLETLGLEPAINREYERTLRELNDNQSQPRDFHLSVVDVLKAHFLVANHFYLEGQGLGGIGPKDIGLLQSAVHRQHASFDGKLKWSNDFDVCATLFFGLIMNHPFYDANKRTAFLSALFQLHRLGRCPSVREREFEDFTVEIANNNLQRYARYEQLLKSNDPDPEVKMISYYFRKNTREIDKKYYTVTFRELQTILSRYNYALVNPHGNHIDIVRIETRKPFLGTFGHEKTTHVWVGQIGFPRWTAEVGKSALKTVREVTGLLSEKGVDSAAFFHGLDPMQTLLTKYHAPLMRLANR